MVNFFIGNSPDENSDNEGEEAVGVNYEPLDETESVEPSPSTSQSSSTAGLRHNRRALDDICQLLEEEIEKEEQERGEKSKHLKADENLGCLLETSEVKALEPVLPCYLFRWPQGGYLYMQTPTQTPADGVRVYPEIEEIQVTGEHYRTRRRWSTLVDLDPDLYTDNVDGAWLRPPAYTRVTYRRRSLPQNSTAHGIPVRDELQWLADFFRNLGSRIMSLCGKFKDYVRGTNRTHTQCIHEQNRELMESMNFRYR